MDGVGGGEVLVQAVQTGTTLGGNRVEALSGGRRRGCGGRRPRRRGRRRQESIGRRRRRRCALDALDGKHTQCDEVAEKLTAVCRHGYDFELCIFFVCVSESMMVRNQTKYILLVLRGCINRCFLRVGDLVGDLSLSLKWVKIFGELS